MTAILNYKINGSETGIRLYFPCPSGLPGVNKTASKCDLQNVIYPFYCYEYGNTGFFYSSSLSSNNYDMVYQVLFSLLPNRVLLNITSNQVVKWIDTFKSLKIFKDY